MAYNQTRSVCFLRKHRNIYIVLTEYIKKECNSNKDIMWTNVHKGEWILHSNNTSKYYKNSFKYLSLRIVLTDCSINRINLEYCIDTTFLLEVKLDYRLKDIDIYVCLQDKNRFCRF